MNQSIAGILIELVKIYANDLSGVSVKRKRRLLKRWNRLIQEACVFRAKLQWFSRELSRESIGARRKIRRIGKRK